MTDWTPQDDWSLLKVGDTVRAEREGCVITGKVIDRYRCPYDTETYALIVRVAGLVDSFRLDRPEWQLSVPAKPAVELPTEPGHYLDREGNGWHIRKGATSSLPEEWAPYTRLEPVAVTAKKVLQDVRIALQCMRDGTRPNGEFIINTNDIDKIATRFGVSDD
tara:strand:- start:2638 stop:3126 length:489 start_codon:yes stop_codon:yes gene_type:complete